MKTAVVKGKIRCWLVLCLGFLCMYMPMQAQRGTYFSIGLNAGFPKMENLDYVVARYNDTRSFLDKEMDDFHLPTGVSMNFGNYFGNFLVDVGLTAQKQKNHAQGVDASTQEVRRDLRLRMNAFNIGIGYRLLSTGVVSITPGISGSLGTYSLSTRVGEVSEVKDQKYEKPVKAFNPGGEVFLQCMFGNPNSTNVKFLVIPYYHYSFNTFDVAPLNTAINPGTAGNDPQFLPVSPRYVGVKVQIAVFSKE